MATDPPRWRAVFDTNVVIAVLKSHNPNSPNVELVRRWRDGEFNLLYAEPIRAEYLEKFQARNVSVGESETFLSALAQHGTKIEVLSSEIIPVIIDDPDDDVLLACAVKGQATHLVTYDPHFDILGGEYKGVIIIRPLHFLYLVRGDTAP